jgi:hypothetical protein
MRPCPLVCFKIATILIIQYLLKIKKINIQHQLNGNDEPSNPLKGAGKNKLHKFIIPF